MAEKGPSSAHWLVELSRQKLRRRSHGSRLRHKLLIQSVVRTAENVVGSETEGRHSHLFQGHHEARHHSPSRHDRARHTHTHPITFEDDVELETYSGRRRRRIRERDRQRCMHMWHMHNSQRQRYRGRVEHEFIASEDDVIGRKFRRGYRAEELLKGRNDVYENEHVSKSRNVHEWEETHKRRQWDAEEELRSIANLHAWLKYDVEDESLKITNGEGVFVCKRHKSSDDVQVNRNVDGHMLLQHCQTDDRPHWREQRDGFSTDGGSDSEMEGTWANSGVRGEIFDEGFIKQTVSFLSEVITEMEGISKSENSHESAATTDEQCQEDADTSNVDGEWQPPVGYYREFSEAVTPENSPENGHFQEKRGDGGVVGEEVNMDQLENQAHSLAFLIDALLPCPWASPTTLGWPKSKQGQLNDMM
eukprot:comp6219_c0_seq1/m.2047 comp6219_c0_seq1/g.2047  ORF comp6219_c0_seq1/g.2047 comp6219_c0_seq1/m.2047 type:complete len:419 (-) comp6219_c0_seq1:85-1341(-)